jgi:uncharacterized protein (DUF983 family)
MGLGDADLGRGARPRRTGIARRGRLGALLAIIGVAVNAVGQMAFMANYPQAYPLWNVLIVALNVVVLYALTAHWRGFKNSLV